MAASILARLTSAVPADELYADSWTCQAVFRALSPLAKQYVLRLLYAPEAVPQATMSSWLAAGARPLHEAALRMLLTLRVCLPSGEKRDLGLNPLFKQRLLSALHEPDTLTSLQPRSEATEDRLDALAKYSQACWDKVLQFMVRAGKHVPSDGLVELIMESKLMTTDGTGGSISNIGFQFLLKDVTAQMWDLLYAYISFADSRGMSKKEVLWFLFQMSFLTAGAEYSTESLTRGQQRLLQDLAELGIVQYFEKRFIPTQLGINLCSGEQYVRQKQEEGYIVVETNYRVYAYTTSDLRVALLSLFVTVQYRLANLAVGVISRESVRDALTHGITSAQIIAFLEQNAHPEVRRKQPIVPETVTDQIRLWESERHRVKTEPGVLYEQFPSVEAFKKAEAYAKSSGHHIWSNSAKQLLFVTEGGHEDVKAWMKKNL